MTDLYAEAMAPIPQLDLRERLDHALATIADTELATVIATAGLAAVHEEWQRCRVDLAVQEDVARAMALRIAQLTDEARRWKRRWAGAVAQGRHEHERAERLRAELADYQLAASEQQGAAARETCGLVIEDWPFTDSIGPCILQDGHKDPWHRDARGAKWRDLPAVVQREPVAGDRVRVVIEGELVVQNSGYDGHFVITSPGASTVQEHTRIPAAATVTVLDTRD